MLDDAILIGRTCAVKAHLEILVVDHHMVMGKFQIGKYGKAPRFIRRIFYFYIPQLHRIVHRYHQRLGCFYPFIPALISHVAHTMAACIVCLI